jgi:hypothetical protein
MKKLLVLFIAGLLWAPALSSGSEHEENVIVYSTYPNNNISYIYVLPAEGNGSASGTGVNIAYLKPPVFSSQIYVSRNYRNILCTKYTICN